MENKVVVITGGSSGAGEALAYRFSSEGFNVVIGGTNLERLKKVQSNIQSSGSKCEYIVHDVSLEREVKKMIDHTIKSYGRLDVLICNAGISYRSVFENANLDVFEKLFRINFFGSIYSVKYSIPHLAKTNGSIIAMSSLNGFIATPTRSAYVSSKHAMQGFFDSIRLELMKKNIHVMVASPGYFESNFRKNTLKSDGNKEGSTSRDEKGMMSTEVLVDKIFEGYKKKKRDLIFTFRGKPVSYTHLRAHETREDRVWRLML